MPYAMLPSLIPTPEGPQDIMVLGEGHHITAVKFCEPFYREQVPGQEAGTLSGPIPLTVHRATRGVQRK